MSDRIKPIFWLWLPIIWMIFQLIGEVIIPPQILTVIHSENGPHELIEFGLLVAGFIIAVHTLVKMDKTNRWLVAWIGIAALACLFVAIEEMSWGQTILKWHTPEFWQGINNQQETNLHNTSKWLNQKPRIVLEIGILVGGIIIPLLRRFKPSALPKRFEIIYPPSILAVIACMAALVKLIDKGGREVFGFDFFTRPSEVEELYLFYFVAIYLLVMKHRLVKRDS
jgi:hypothetical protein